MKLVITIDTWGGEHDLRIYDDWNIYDVLKEGHFIYDNGDDNYTEKFINFYQSKTKESISNIEDICYIDTESEYFKPNESFYSPEYYKSDPLNKFKLYGK